jgi:hypothetical protein
MAGLTLEQLIPVLPTRPGSTGVCRICHGVAPEGYVRCFPCHQLRDEAQLPAELKTLPLAISLAESPLAIALFRYKNDYLGDTPQSYFQAQVLQLLSFGLRHLSCLSSESNVSFSIATWVPSGRQRSGIHPLEELLQASSDSRLVEHLLSTLEPGGGPAIEHQFSPRRFTASRIVHGQHILLIDDTWTRGASIFSAAHALYEAGAKSVNCLVIGRHMNPGHQDPDRYLDRAKSLGFDPRYCTFCDTRRVGATDAQ